MTFMPTPGRVTAFHAPGGLGVRIDSALYAGYVVPPYYDSLVAKLIVHAPTRADAINRLRRALDEFAVVGIQTTIPLHQRIVDDADVPGGRLHDPLAGTRSSHPERVGNAASECHPGEQKQGVVAAGIASETVVVGIAAVELRIDHILHAKLQIGPW